MTHDKSDLVSRSGWIRYDDAQAEIARLTAALADTQAQLVVARAAGMREAAGVVSGSIYKERYTEWTWRGAGNYSNESDLVKFSIAAHNEILARADAVERGE